MANETRLKELRDGYGVPKIVRTSAKKTATATVLTGPGVLMAIWVESAGVTDAKVTVYDNTSASGDIIREFTALSTSPNVPTGQNEIGLKIDTGIHVVLNPDGGHYFVDYYTSPSQP